MSETVCRPVIRSRSSRGPSVMFTTLLKRYARPCRPWKAFEMISSWSDVWHRQLLQEYIRFPFRYCLNSRPIAPGAPTAAGR